MKYIAKKNSKILSQRHLVNVLKTASKQTKTCPHVCLLFFLQVRLIVSQNTLSLKFKLIMDSDEDEDVIFKV